MVEWDEFRRSSFHYSEMHTMMSFPLNPAGTTGLRGLGLLRNMV